MGGDAVMRPAFESDVVPRPEEQIAVAQIAPDHVALLRAAVLVVRKRGAGLHPDQDRLAFVRSVQPELAELDTGYAGRQPRPLRFGKHCVRPAACPFRSV